MLSGLILMAAFAATSPGLAADGFTLANLTEHVDVALEATSKPVGEMVASYALGPADLNLQHRESLGTMAELDLYGRPKNTPLARSSLVGTETGVSLAQGVEMPVGVSFGLDEWEKGNRNLRLVARNGLELSDLRVNHRMTLTNSFAADGTQTQRSAGRLGLNLNLFGGRHEGVMEYGATPLAEVTHLRMNSEWAVDGEEAAVVGLTHRPLTEQSEARLGYRRPVAAFRMTTEVAADNGGGYAAGLQISLPLGPTTKPESWSLSTLVANLRADREAALPVGSEAYAFEDAN